jgi:hypothetical protein
MAVTANGDMGVWPVAPDRPHQASQVAARRRRWRRRLAGSASTPQAQIRASGRRCASGQPSAAALCRSRPVRRTFTG